MTNALPAATHTDLSHSYTGPAFLTTAVFVFCGIVHKARRFWRSDMPSTGKIEIYTVEPYNTESTSTELGWNTFAAEDSLRLVNEENPSRLDTLAMMEIAKASGGLYSTLHIDSVSRFAGVELP